VAGEWKTPWDDDTGGKSLYMLYRWETDPSLRIKYRMCLNRHWHDWKTLELKTTKRSFIICSIKCSAARK
jgi:hypothetical protein